MSIKDKLLSRKLWVSIGSFVTMIAVATGKLTESEATQVAAIIMAGATVLGYVLGEGLVDSESVKANSSHTELTKHITEVSTGGDEDE